MTKKIIKTELTPEAKTWLAVQRARLTLFAAKSALVCADANARIQAWFDSLKKK